MKRDKIIAMIPARLGSKRVIKKNIRYLCGKPLIQYAIEAAVGSGCFDEIWVNSENAMIGELAVSCGVGFHKRPAGLSVDTATNQDFTAEFLHVHDCRFVVMVNPTSPLLQVDTVKRFCAMLKNGEYDTVVSVLEERAECFFNGVPVNFSLQRKINSQNLNPVEKIVWALTAWRRSAFLDLIQKGACGVFGGRLGRFSIPLNESCDIDTEEEWALAEALFARQEKRWTEKTGERFIPTYWGEPVEKK